MKNKLFLSAILVLMSTSIAIAQQSTSQNPDRAFTYVQQNGVKIDKLGTAAFELADESHPTVTFDDAGNAVMTIGDNTVAVLPMSDNGQLVVELETTEAEANLNKVTKTFTNDYATLYSPFQLQVPESSQVQVYAPTYNSSTHLLKCNSTTLIAGSSVIPAEKALLLKNAGTIEFAISDGESTDTHVSVLSGSSLLIDLPDIEPGNTLFTLGHESKDASKYGFFEYTGTKLNPGLAWLEAPSLSSQAKYYAISLDDETTGLSMNVNGDVDVNVNRDVNRNMKFIENGRVVIVKNGIKYNLNGQKVK